MMKKFKGIFYVVFLSALTVIAVFHCFTLLQQHLSERRSTIQINVQQLINIPDLYHGNPFIHKRDSNVATQPVTLQSKKLNAVDEMCFNQQYQHFKNLTKQLYNSSSLEIKFYVTNRCEAKGKCKPETVGRVQLDFRRLPLEEIYDVDAIEALHPGGWYMPKHPCHTKSVAVIVPYRNREQQLAIFLRHYHRILQSQQLHYRIFIVEQVDKSPFNRGKLMNVGFAEAMKYFPYDCFVFHDVDLILEDDRVFYDCPSSPMHLSVALDKFKYRLLYEELFGGIEMFTTRHFKQVNGFSNSFWGWGAEDDNLYRRLKWKGLTLWRPSATLARYTMLQHDNAEAKAKPERFDIRKESYKHFATDGLNSLQYKVKSSQLIQSHTLIKVDLQKNKDFLFGVKS